MIDIDVIRQDPHAFDEAMIARGSPIRADQLLPIDLRRRDGLTAMQTRKSRLNAVSDAIGQHMRAGEYEQAQLCKTEATAIKAEIEALDDDGVIAAETLRLRSLYIPNLPAADVPVGLDESANLVISTCHRDCRTGRAHDEIGRDLGMMDFETAAAMSGSRFVILSGQLARLERALGQFMLDVHTGGHGYREISPPLIVNQQAMTGTGQLPKFQDDLYDVGGFKYLIPTAEVSLTNLVADKIVDAVDLPLRYTALTPCFRSEAGSAGRDVRGMLRQHQFYKVELVSITNPELSDNEHDIMLSNAARILTRLELPHRIVKLCTGDMGFSARRTYDIEVWMPSQSAYREISSVSHCGDFQARRLNARFREGSGKPRFVHTLNGSGLAVGRTLIAIMENYQTDGGFMIPEALSPYLNGLQRIVRR